MTTVYLAGGIAGCTDHEAKDWRATATAALTKAGYTVKDPMARDYRGIMNHQWTMDLVDECVGGDLRDIASSDVVLARAVSPSWGTAMEIVHARKLGKKIIAFGVGLHNAAVSPWILYHCHVCCETFEQGLQQLIRGYTLHG